MALTLTAADRVLLTKALEVISSPLDAVDVDAWRGDVLRVLQPLFHADAGSFVLPHDGEPSVTLLNRPQQYLDDYVKHQMLDITLDVWREQGFAPACTESLCNGDRSVYTESDIYHLAFGPYKIEDALCTILDIADRPAPVGRGRYFAPRGVPVTGMFCMYSERAGSPRFGVEGLELFTLLHPVIRSAAQTWHNLARWRAQLAGVVDQVSDALAIYTPAGKLVHANPALARLLDAERGRRAVEAEGSSMAVELWRAGSMRHVAVESTATAFERELCIGAVRYTLRATRMDAGLGPRAVVLVSVRARGTGGAPHRDLRRRFALTARQAEVATLLAAGASNAQIAAALGVTEHTARRHTEAVMRKMRVESRAQVAAKVLSED